MRQGTRMRQSTRAVREGADTHKLKCVSHKLKCVCLVQICGAVCSLRQKQDRIAVWTKDASVCAPIFPAPLLPFPPLPSPSLPFPPPRPWHYRAPVLRRAALRERGAWRHGGRGASEAHTSRARAGAPGTGRPSGADAGRWGGRVRGGQAVGMSCAWPGAGGERLELRRGCSRGWGNPRRRAKSGKGVAGPLRKGSGQGRNAEADARSTVGALGWKCRTRRHTMRWASRFGRRSTWPWAPRAKSPRASSTTRSAVARLPPLASLPLPPCPRPRPRTLVCARMVWAGFLALCLRVLLVACVCLSRGACSARW